MRAQKRLPSQLILLFGGVGLLFSAATFFFIYQNLTSGSTDLLPRWIGATLFFEEGINPYDERVGVESQMEIYGRIAEPDEDQVLFAYPFYTIFYIGPLVLVEYQLAAAIYIQIMLIVLLAGLGLSLNLIEWLPSPLMLATLILFTIIGYFSIRGLLLAQLAIIGYLGHIIALWAIYRERDYLAGVGLALSTIKPQTGYLVIPFLLLWAWRRRRYGIPISFGVLFGLMLALSFILQPSWLGDWITQIRDYQNYTETIASAQVVTHFIDGIPSGVEDAAQIILTLILLIPVLIFWKRSLIDNDQSDFLWGYFLTMTFSLLVAPRTATTYYVELYPVIYVTLLIVRSRLAAWQIYAALIGLVIGYWALFLATVPPPDEHGVAGFEDGIVYVIFPALVWALLFIYRDGWRAIQPIQMDMKKGIRFG